MHQHQSMSAVAVLIISLPTGVFASDGTEFEGQPTIWTTPVDDILRASAIAFVGTVVSAEEEIYLGPSDIAQRTVWRVRVDQVLLGSTGAEELDVSVDTPLPTSPAPGTRAVMLLGRQKRMVPIALIENQHYADIPPFDDLLVPTVIGSIFTAREGAEAIVGAWDSPHETAEVDWLPERELSTFNDIVTSISNLIDSQCVPPCGAEVPSPQGGSVHVQP